MLVITIIDKCAFSLSFLLNDNWITRWGTIIKSSWQDMAKEGKFDGGHLTQNPPQTTLQCLISFDAHNVYKVLLCSFDRIMARLKK